METIKMHNTQAIARRVGLTWLATIVIGVLAAILLAEGIDINLSADVEMVSAAMLEAELRLRALAYIALLVFVLEVVVSIGLYLLLKHSGQWLAGVSMVAKLFASGLGLIGAIFTMNSAEIASHPAYQALADSSQRMLVNGIQATSSYTSFHLSLVLSSVALAGFYWLFLRSGRIPKLIAGWGLFACIFVASAIVLRDFIPVLGHTAISLAFMVSNLIALLSTSLYLSFKGVNAGELRGNRR